MIAPMSWIDSLFCALFAVISPLYSVWGYRRLERDVTNGVAGARMREYAETIALLWLFGLGALAVWVGQGRPLAEIGVSAPRGWPIVPAILLSGAIVWFLSAQLARVKKMIRRPVVGVAEIESVEALLPEDPREVRAFTIAALSAGVFEEVLYRGYLIAFLESYVPLWVAVIVSSLAFAYGHSYQGVSNMPRIFLLSLVLAGLYLWTGSLLIPIVLHAFVDINSMLTARAVLSKWPAPESSEAAVK